MKAEIQSTRWYLWISVLTLMIIALGIFNLHSAAAVGQASFYGGQLKWLAMGIAVTAFIVWLDYHWTEYFAYLFYGLICFLLVAVLLQGRIAGGAQRWLELGPFSFQPSELAKIATILCLARFLSHPEGFLERGYSLRDFFGFTSPTRPLIFAAFLFVFWSSAWLKFPEWKVAEKLREHVGDMVDTESWALRVGLLVLFVLLGALLFWWVFSLDRRSALLNPWSPIKKRLFYFFAIGSAFSGVVFVLWHWRSPWMVEPLYFLKVWAFAQQEPLSTTLWGWIFRSLLVCGMLGYGWLSVWKLLHDDSRHGIYCWVAPADLLFLPVGLILVEPDLGTAGIVLLIGASMLLVVGVRFRSLLFMAVLGLAGSTAIWFGVMREYQKLRILTFLNPEHDVRGSGWNAVQSMIAVGSGKFWGRGHGGGTQTQLSFLPEKHTDFAFSVWAEEHGFLGCFILLSLYAALIVLILICARNARDLYGQLLVVGVAALLFWHAVINIAMVIGVFPIVGITLPFFSYGGTSLIVKMIALGWVLNVSLRH